MSSFGVAKIVLTFVFTLVVLSSASAGNWNQSSSSAEGFFCEPNSSGPFTSFGKKIEHRTHSSGVIEFPGRYELPQNLKPCPNDKTLSSHYMKWLGEIYKPNQQVLAADNPSTFKSALSDNQFLDEQLQYNGILSYLFYSNGTIIHDGIAPQARFNFTLDNETEFRSNSVGKSVVSYLIGHAVCEGYMNSLDEPLSSWPVLDNTLYSNLKLIDVLNMRAGDHLVVTEAKGFVKTGRWFNPVSIKSAAENELKGTKPEPNKKYNYNGFATNVAMNFMVFKVGDNWQSFLNKIFREKIKIQSRFIIMKANGYDADGTAWYSAYANRYDYLRIAEAMMKDWQNNTCVGKYLKEVYQRKKQKDKMSWIFDKHPKQVRDSGGFASHYGGQFHFNYRGMTQRTIIGMDGYGGQSILIDIENSRIVVVNAASTNYDWYELVYQPIKTGKLRQK